MQTTPDNPVDLPDWVVVAEGTPDEVDPLALVLEAVDIPFLYDQRAGRMLVSVDDLSTALFHLEEYHRENVCWPPAPPPSPPLSSQSLPTMPALLCLALFFAHTGSWTPNNDWFVRGALNNIAVFDHGEWWRLLTALTLHADSAHLLGNCLIGGVIIHLLSRMIGFGQCWLLLIITGAFGNFVNIVMRQEMHLAVGFSTSVFAAIGLLTGLQMAHASHNPIKAFLLPLGAGAGLLAFLGSEGARTDLGAHLFGFTSGLACGWLGKHCRLIARLQATIWQFFFFLLALALPITAWVWALMT